MSINRWVDKEDWYKYTVEYYSAIKRNKIGPFVVMWMNLVSVIQSEISQKEKTNITHINFDWPWYIQHWCMHYVILYFLLAQSLCFNCIHIWYGESLSVLNPKSLLAINISLDRTSEHQPAFYNIYPSSWQLRYCFEFEMYQRILRFPAIHIYEKP